MVLSSFAPVLANSQKITVNNRDSIIPIFLIFGDSYEEKLAISDLSENFPNNIKTEINSIDELNLLSGINNPIIWIGHGNDDGILFQNKIISWDEISKFITLSQSNYHFFLSCSSSILTELTIETGKYVYGFESLIDAEFGVNIISILISKLFGIGVLFNFIKKAIARLSITPDNSEYNGMYITGRLGLYEAIVRGTNAILLFSAIFFTVSATIMGATITTAYAAYATAGLAAWMLYLIFGIFNSAISGNGYGIVLKLSAFISAFFAFGKFVIAYVSFLVAAALSAALGTDLASTPPKLPMYPAIIILAVGAAIVEVWKFVDDYNDYGDVPR